MFGLRRNIPPVYDQRKSYQENFGEFFHWAVSLKHPMRQIPEIGDELGFGVRRHPIGFVAVYLSERDHGFVTAGITGIARANIYPRGVIMKEDVHCHGFKFMAGNAEGTLINTVHTPDWLNPVAEGEGYVGYESWVDWKGQNHTVKVSDATIHLPPGVVHELSPGDTYSLRPRVDFHSVSAGDEGAVTMFCKTPTREGNEGRSLMLKLPSEAPPPPIY